MVTRQCRTDQTKVNLPRYLPTRTSKCGTIAPCARLVIVARFPSKSALNKCLRAYLANTKHSKDRGRGCPEIWQMRSTRPNHSNSTSRTVCYKKGLFLLVMRVKAATGVLRGCNNRRRGTVSSLVRKPSTTRWKCSTWRVVTAWPRMNLNMGMGPSAAAIVISGPATTSTLNIRRSRNRFNLSATFRHSWARNPPRRPTWLNVLRLCLPFLSQGVRYVRLCLRKNVKGLCQGGCRRLWALLGSLTRLRL